MVKKIRDQETKLKGMMPTMGDKKRIFDRLKKKSIDSSPMSDNSVQLNSTINDLPLIMDIGMNNGRDSRFYLEKGFRVVAVEANPILVNLARQDFADYIASGQLIIEPIGLGSEEGKFTF